MIFLHEILTYLLWYIWHVCVFCTQVKVLWPLSLKCYLWKNMLSSRNKSYVAKFDLLSMPMIRGGKNGFFSVTSVPFHGMNSNWNIHFTITTTCTERTGWQWKQPLCQSSFTGQINLNGSDHKILTCSYTGMSANKHNLDSQMFNNTVVYKMVCNTWLLWEGGWLFLHRSLHMQQPAATKICL